MSSAWKTEFSAHQWMFHLRFTVTGGCQGGGHRGRDPGGSVVKNLPASAGDTGLIPKIPWKRAQQPTPVFLPGKSHGQRSLLGYSPQGCKKIGHDLATKQKQQSNIQWEILRRNMTWGTMGNLEKSPPLSLCGLNSFS